MNLLQTEALEIYLARILPRLEINGECLECKLSDNGHGYVCVHVRPFRLYAHRITYQAYFGDIPDGLSVLHKCDNRPCCNPYHLFVGTQKDNMQDKMKKGRAIGPQLLGEQNPAAKLTWEIVSQIRSSNETQRKLAVKYGVSQVLIGKVKRYEIWKTVFNYIVESEAEVG